MTASPHLQLERSQRTLRQRQIRVAVSGLLLGAHDQTVVATALPTIFGESGGLSQLSWVITAYLAWVGEVLILAVQSAVDQRELGTATGAANLFRALGGAVGVAVYGSIFTDQLRAGIASALSPVFVTAALMAVAGFLAVLFLDERPLRQQAQPEPIAGGGSDLIAHRRTTHVHA